MAPERSFGLGRGRAFPASSAWQLEIGVRKLLEPPRRLVRRFPLEPGHRVLELGCGPGFFSVALGERVGVGGLELFDLQHEMLVRARGKLVPRASSTQGDALALPFRDRSFHAVVVVDVLGEIPDPQRAMAEIARVLRPGGFAAFGEVRLDPDFTSFARLRALAEHAGLVSSGRSGWALHYTATFRRG